MTRIYLKFLVIILSILGITNSCSTVEDPVPNNNDSDTIINDTTNYNNDAPMYGIPRAKYIEQ